MRAAVWWSLVAGLLDAPFAWMVIYVSQAWWVVLLAVLPAATALLTAYGCWRDNGREEARAAVWWHSIVLVLAALPTWLLSPFLLGPSLLIIVCVRFAERERSSVA